MSAVRLKPLAEQVVVVTGASSGIGRATARMAAARGAAVVGCARGAAGLDSLVAEIVGAGGRASAIVADVIDPAAMMRLADHARAAFGAIDTWVNNAGVAIAGRLEDLAEDEARRVFEIDFWGMVHGCKAALPHLRARGGVLVNIGSVASDVASPYMGLYSTTKQAIKAYTDALRIELMTDRAPVAVTLVKPAPIATRSSGTSATGWTGMPPCRRPSIGRRTSPHRARRCRAAGARPVCRRHGAAGQRAGTRLPQRHRCRRRAHGAAPVQNGFRPK